MNKPLNEDVTDNVPSTSASPDGPNSKNKPNKNRGKKRKRISSGSSSEDEEILPDNAFATERNLHASAVKNNLDDISVRKILKKVVTNDHVLALVKLREEEDSGPEDKNVIPKLTRSKAKELKKVSPKSTAWNLENLELTPIKHIPVKTRPEVKALIAQELPEDEDDDEYEPTPDDVPSDDDHVESSDVDSQPRTPATPSSVQDSPVVVKDGPFKVPQEVSKARRKLEIEEATIALRTRSKLSLSSTPIEHIESNFVPPDDIPMTDVDDLWNEFLNECLNPETEKNEDDDEADPEYNVAADPDALDEDEDALGRSIIKISKKELHDLVNELFNIIPDTTDEVLAENLANSVLTDTSQNEVSHWEGKQEPPSDDETDVTSPGKRQSTRFSIGKSETAGAETETEDTTQKQSDVIKVERINKTPMITIMPVQLTPPPSAREKYPITKMTHPTNVSIAPPPKTKTVPNSSTVSKSNQPMLTITPLQMSIEEGDPPNKSEDEPPPSLRKQIQTEKNTYEIYISDSVHISQEQRLILQQQLRMHIQLATQNFLQLFVHPIHWCYAQTYKEYLTSLTKMCENNPDSIVDVCNLKPAMELVNTWEEAVSADTAVNREMIEFVKKEVDKSRRRFTQNSLYFGEFHPTFQKVIANSSVFLYPYLLPSMPYRGDPHKRGYYLHSEDELIVLGIDQFWEYVENNPQIYKRPKTLDSRKRWGLSVSLDLVVKHMLPWMTTKGLHNHISLMRKSGDKHNPIYRYFKLKEMNQVQHKLLPFNPSMTLYEQPEYEIPRIWLKYLAKTSTRFKKYLYRKVHVTGRQPDGVPIIGTTEPIKRPLPIQFTKQITCGNRTAEPKIIPPDRYDIEIETTNVENTPNVPKTSTLIVQNLYRFVETTTGAFLLPLVTSTVNCTQTVTTPMEVKTFLNNNMPIVTSKSVNHCSCCIFLRGINKKQKLITDYFNKNKYFSRNCQCSEVEVTKVTNRLKLLVNSFKDRGEVIKNMLSNKFNETDSGKYSNEDLALVTSYQLKLLNLTQNKVVRNKCTNYFNNFNLELDDPLIIASQLKKLFEGQVTELYLDFLVFLTGEQAEKLGSFREYFVRNCVENLVRKIEEQVSNKEPRHVILSQLKQLVTGNVTNSCQMCTSLLHTMKEYPKLAEYTFGLFPHRKEDAKVNIPIVQQKTEEKLQNNIKPQTVSTEDDESNHEMVVDENGVADESSSSDEDEDPNDYEITIEENELVPPAIKKESSPEPIELLSTPNSVEKCNSSMTIVFEEESIKQEQIEWKRDEDKIILEMLKQELTPEERRGKPLARLLEEMKVYDAIADLLPQKSKSEIEDRISYLLSLLMLSENC